MLLSPASKSVHAPQPPGTSPPHVSKAHPRRVCVSIHCLLLTYSSHNIAGWTARSGSGRRARNVPSLCRNTTSQGRPERVGVTTSRAQATCSVLLLALPLLKPSHASPRLESRMAPLYSKLWMIPIQRPPPAREPKKGAELLTLLKLR